MITVNNTFRMSECAMIQLDEKALIKLLTHLPDDDIELRPYLQKAGENIFGW